MGVRIEPGLYELLKGALILRLSSQRHEVIRMKNEVAFPRLNGKWLPVPNPGEECRCISWWAFAQSTKACVLQDDVR
jgi:hypothetical protein